MNNQQNKQKMIKNSKASKPINTKLKKIMLVQVIFILASILTIVGILLIKSPGKTRPYVDEKGNVIAGSLSEKIFISIGGVRQGMFIQSKDTSHPVLLYIHGGLPFYFLAQKYPTGLEEHFTVVWWEQRGSGISFNADNPVELITSEQVLKDVVEVTNYLRKRFGKDKIYLMGHSGGSFLGIMAAAHAPELYYAYIGVAQMSDQLQSERLAHEYMLNYYKEHKNKKMVRNLEAAPVIDSTPDTYLKFRDKAMHEAGIGTMHHMRSVISGIFIPSLLCEDYSFKEKINMWRGKARSGVSPFWMEMLSTNLINKIYKLDIPIYFFGGEYDYTVSYTLSKEYFEKIEAPVKGFYTFNRSAHSPIFEEPEKTQQIFKEDILKGRNFLADLK